MMKDDDSSEVVSSSSRIIDNVKDGYRPVDVNNKIHNNNNPPPTATNIMIANALGSACAGIISRIFTHPLDTAKAILQAPIQQQQQQINSNNYKGPVDVILRTIHTEGIRGLYRGFDIIIVGGTPGTICYLCTYEYAKETLSNVVTKNSNSNNYDFFVHFTSGMIAETLACIIYVPVDVIKERLQVQNVIQQQPSSSLSTSSTLSSSSPSTVMKSSSNIINNTSTLYYYKNGYDALKQILKTEGLKGIYKGYGATLASFGPFSAFYFTFYEQVKYWARQHIHDTNHNNDSSSSKNDSHRHHEKNDSSVTLSARELEKNVELPFLWIILCSCTAGTAASWLTSPLDMVKLRLQIQRASSSSSLLKQQPNIIQQQNIYPNTMLSCLRHIYQNEGGIRALFRGAGARVLHFAPATTITMTLYETCRSFFIKNSS